MHKPTICFVVCFVSIAGLCYAQDTVEFEGRYWLAGLDAKAKAVESNIGSTFDLDSDLGIKDEDYPEGIVTWHINSDHRVRAAFTQAAYRGSRTITQSIDFNGKTYMAGALIDSDLDLYYFRLGWIWQFIRFSNERVKLGTLLEGKGVFADTALKAPNLVPALSESEEYLVGLPTAGLALNIQPFTRMDLYAEGAGMSGGDYGYFIEAEAGAKILPTEHLSVTVGYRYLDVKAKNEDDFLKMKISGFFAGATIRF
ncbi:MAG: hypothetical protein ABH845_00515 [Candidatus Omnitrophota bacterium]